MATCPRPCATSSSTPWSAEVVAEERGNANGVTGKDRGKDKGDIEQNPKGRDPIFPGQPEELVIVEHDQVGKGDIVEEFRSAVATGLPEHPGRKSGPGQPQQACVFPGEVEERQAPANAFTDGG